VEARNEVQRNGLLELYCEPPASGARVVAAEARRMRAADAYRLRQGWRDFLL